MPSTRTSTISLVVIAACATSAHAKTTHHSTGTTTKDGRIYDEQQGWHTYKINPDPRDPAIA